MPPVADQHITEAQRDAAAEWLVRLEGDRDGAQRPAFELWLAADVRHAAAFAAAAALWQTLLAPAEVLAAERRPQLQALLQTGLPVQATMAPPRRRSRVWNWASGALAACLLAALAWSLQPMLGGWLQNLSADLVTSHGEIRRFVLADGSVLTLAGNSAAGVDYDERRRHIRLLRGEAFFDVRASASSGGRDFTVDARGAGVHVVGTRFNLRRVGDRIEVAVEEGLVDVSAPQDARSVRLSAGQQVAVADGRFGTAGNADLDRILAWRSERLVFYRESLADVAARLEQQRAGRIVVAGDRLAGLSVSGVFPAGDVDGTLDALADTLGLRVLRLTPWLTVLR